MPIYTVQGPDGRTYDIEGPQGATADQLGSFIQSQARMLPNGQPMPPGFTPVNQDSGPIPNTPAPVDPQEAAFKDTLRSVFDPSSAQGALAGEAGGLAKIGTGALHYLGKGLGLLGADDTGNALTNIADTASKKVDALVKPYRDAAPLSTGAGEFGSEFLATLPVGGVIGKAVEGVAPLVGKAAPYVKQLASAIRSGGVSLNAPAATSAGGKLLATGLRSAGGAITGGTQAALANPGDGATGAKIGAAFPVAGQAIAAGSKALGGALRSNISPEVVALANRAKALGIDVPADRLANSKPLNAVAAGLNYIPFSGRAATEAGMQSQMNRALSRTVGQDSDNVTMALRKASGDLGDEFDRVLKNNTVKVDPQFNRELDDVSQQAASELPSDSARVIQNQIDEIRNGTKSGEIDGQLAYNIKRTLDRIGKQNTPQAFYAGDLKRVLMGALNRSLGTQEAAQFAKTRQQYGNMLALEKLAQNGTDGDVSIARIANMKNIRNPDLQELADIAARFLKPREGEHGAAQRAFAALGAGALGTGAAYMGSLAMPASIAGGAALGRALNMGLNNGVVKNAVLGQGVVSPALINALRQSMPIASRAAPLISAQ